MKNFKYVLPIAGIFLMGGCAKEDALTLNVYNWGQYISDGSEGTLNVNEEFEKYYLEEYGKKVKVNYTTYASNEDMYNKIKNGSASYDVVIPSDYMIERMIKEELLLKLDFDNIPNYKYIDDAHRDLFFDPNNEYSVPYTYGTVGIIYNETMVDEEDVGSWDLLWNEKYEGQILQFNNPRDAFATALYYAGEDVNTSEPQVWEAAVEKLKTQKPLIQSYVMDEIFNKMKNGSAAIAPYYAGDYLVMYDSNDSLKFYYPEEGTNTFVDSMCIPSCAKNKELAECYINFMLTDEIATANAEYVAYSSPNTNVVENEDYVSYMLEWNDDVMDILYPDIEGIKATYFENLDTATLDLQNGLWESLKIENSVEPWVYVTSISIVSVLLIGMLYRYAIKKIRDNY